MYSREQYQGAALEMGCVEAVSAKHYAPGIRMKCDADTDHLSGVHGTFWPHMPRGYLLFHGGERRSACTRSSKRQSFGSTNERRNVTPAF